MDLISKVCGRCWAIRPEVIANLRSFLAFEAAAAPASERNSPKRGGSVAVIPVYGTLTQHGEKIGWRPTYSVDALAASVTRAAADSSIDAIVLELDTPGGEVFGVTEAHSVIRAASKSKPVVAAVNSMAGSAGYWLASATDRIVVTPGGEVGSIGVYTTHVDQSRALDAAGVTVSFVSAGRYKVEGNPAEPLGDEARSAMQADVDRYYGMFVADVASGRKVSRDVVRNGFGEGRMVGAREAVEQGMADEVGTVAKAITVASQLSRARRSSAAAIGAEALR